jgi:hypothetical protein
MFRNVGCSVFNREWLSSDRGSGSSTADGELRDVGHRMACGFTALVDASLRPNRSIDMEVGVWGSVVVKALRC